MKKLQIVLTLIALFIALAARADLSESSLVPQEEMNFAKDYLNQLREQNFDYVKSHIDPELSSQISEDKLEEFSAYFPAGELLSTELIGSHVNTSISTWQGNFSFEYEFDSGWALANVVLKRIGDKTSVIGLSVYRTEASQKELNKFELSGKSALHYLVLALAGIVPAFIIVTLFYCIKSPIPKRKWLWVLFVLGGIGTITINWTTGLYEVRLLQYQLFGAGASTGSEHAPWLITVGLPLGAIIFWYKRKSFIEQDKANKSSQQDAELS